MPDHPEKTSAGLAAHYLWGEGCDGWRLAQSSGLSVIEERMPPGTQEQRHFHRQAQQFFYVIQGRLALEVAGKQFTLEVHEGLEVAPRWAHQATNNSDSDVRFLVISQPPSQGDRVLAPAASRPAPSL